MAVQSLLICNHINMSYLSHLSATQMDIPTHDRVAWIINEIAESGLNPGAPGTSWAGQGDITARVVNTWGLKQDEAQILVQLALSHLYAGEETGPVHVERRLLKNRLNAIRVLILKGVREPKTVTTYRLRKRKEENGEIILVKTPVKETVKNVMDVNFVRLLIDIEGMIAKLDHLEKSGGTAGETVAEIFNKMEEHSDGSTTKQTMTSIKTKVDGIDVSKFSEAGKQVIQDAMVQESRRKSVKSSIKNAA